MNRSSPAEIIEQPKPPFPPQHQEKPGLESKMTPRPRYEAPNYRAADKLKDQVALITGGDSGIGRAVAYLYAREGARVAIVYLPEEQSDAEETKRAIEDISGKCLLLAGDITDKKFCEQAITQAVEFFGRLDILVNNAAYQNRIESIEEITDEEWHKTFQTNITAGFYLCRAARSHLQPGSSIIMTSSATGLEGSEKLLAYSATKGAINAFTKTLALDLVHKGIRVNAVAPGPVWTPLNTADRGKPAEKVSTFGEKTFFKRPAQPEEIAPAYVFLASHADSSFITGIVLEEIGKTTAG